MWKLEKQVSDELGGHVKFALYRDVLLHTAAIIEGTLHHALERYVKDGGIPASDIMPKEEQYKKPIVLHKFSVDEVLIAVTRVKRPLPLKSNTQFKDINQAAKKVGLLSSKLYSKSEDVRKKRNNIHLAGKSTKEVYPSKKDIDSIFRSAKEILEAANFFLRSESVAD